LRFRTGRGSTISHFNQFNCETPASRENNSAKQKREALSRLALVSSKQFGLLAKLEEHCRIGPEQTIDNRRVRRFGPDGLALSRFEVNNRARRGTRHSK
jgi:hypothetical protein